MSGLVTPTVIKRGLLSGLVTPTGIKDAFYPVGNTNWDKRVTHLSRLVLPPGIKGALLSRVEPPTGTNGGPFVRVGGSTRDKKPLSPTLARLAIGPGTKATFYPGPKGNRDK